MGILSLNRKLRLLNPLLLRMVEETLTLLETEIITLNQQQLTKGEKSDGTFTGEYRETTISRKMLEGRFLTGDKISLLDRGDFWAGFLVKADNGKLIFDSTDAKTEMLISIYSEKLFGLTSESKTELAKLAKPILYEKITNFLNKA